MSNLTRTYLFMDQPLRNAESEDGVPGTNDREYEETVQTLVCASSLLFKIDMRAHIGATAPIRLE